MGSDKRSHFLIACRYVPHDQWFLTNTSPSWKIKHLKQSIIAKALNLPFDRRLMMEDLTAHPPSPITFAPIEGALEESDEVGKTQADYRMQGQGTEGRNFTDFKVAGTPEAPPSAPVVDPPFTESKDQISTNIFTLIRFSTGQILEEHLPVSWYDLGRHELVELHCSSPPARFSQALVFGSMLMNGGSITVDVPTATLGSHTLNANPDRHSSSSPSLAISPESSTATLTLALADPLRLTSLPRHDLPSYTEPYWEGWIRVLRVMSRSPAFLVETFPRATIPDSGRAWKADKRTKTKEWRERWAVIRNGVLSLCKNRDDPICTQLPLSALVSLCGPEYFSSGHSDTEQLSTNISGGGSGGDSFKRPNSSHSNLAPTIRAARPASFSDPSSRVTPVEIEDIGTRKYMLTATSNSATAPRVLSPLITQTTTSRLGANRNPPLTTIPTPANHTTLLPVDPERSRRERAAVREWERERIQQEMAERARLDKPVEYGRWDDFVIFGGKSKTKSKENEKDSSRSGKVREEKEQKSRKNLATISARHPLIAEGGTEKHKDRNRENRQRGNIQDHHDRFFHLDDRYVPGSREEAIAKGMLVVCAKFKIDIVEDMNKARKKDEHYALSPFQNINLDASVASNEGGESGRKTRFVHRNRRRNAEWQQPQSLESSPVMKFSPPPRKASLPGLGLTMLSGGNITPGGSMFGGFFGNRDRDHDKAEKIDKPDGLHSKDEEGKGRHHVTGNSIRSPFAGSATLRGMLGDYHVGYSTKPPDLNEKKLHLSVDTAMLSVNDRQLDEGQVSGYQKAEHCDSRHTEERADREQKRKIMHEDRVEWVVMDLGTETAYNSFLRILHRHSSPPIQSSFIPMVSPFQPPSPSHFHDVVTDTQGFLPYPEWRREVVFRARSQGTRELGRPLELLFKTYDWETQAARHAQARKSPNEPGRKDITDGNTNKRRRNTMSEPDHGSDDDNDNSLGMEDLMLDDSEDESEDESACWWQGIPRQPSSEERDFEWSTTGHWSGTEENTEEYSPASPNMLFTDPFALSPSHPDFDETILSSLDVEGRLRPSISSSTLASNNTSSSISMFGASSSNLRGSNSVLLDGERAVDSPPGIPWQKSPESYQLRYPRRIVSPSQTLSSPSSNESLGSYPYHRLPARPFSPPSSDFYLPNPYRQPSGSTSVLHHSVSMPNASTWRSIPSSGTTQTDMIREQAVTPPALRNLQKPTLSVADLDVQLPSSEPHDDFPANFDRPILTPAQIRQIETETDARIGGDYTQGTPGFGITDSITKPKISTPVFNQSSLSSVFQQEALANDSGALARNSVTRRFMHAGSSRTHPTSATSPPFSFRDQANIDSASISAKAILRRVRSGSSLQTPMGVHFEESEDDDED